MGNNTSNSFLENYSYLRSHNHFLLRLTEEDILNNDKIIKTYKDSISYGLIKNYSENRSHKKFISSENKISDIKLAILTTYKSLNENLNSRQSENFKNKLLNTLSKQITILTSHADPYNFYLKIRRQLMTKIYLIYCKEIRRLHYRRNNNESNLSTDKKIDFINKLFDITFKETKKEDDDKSKMSKDATKTEQPSKHKRHKTSNDNLVDLDNIIFPKYINKDFYLKVIELVDTLPQIYGITGLSPSKDKKIIEGNRPSNVVTEVIGSDNNRTLNSRLGQLNIRSVFSNRHDNSTESNQNSDIINYDFLDDGNFEGYGSSEEGLSTDPNDNSINPLEISQTRVIIPSANDDNSDGSHATSFNNTIRSRMIRALERLRSTRRLDSSVNLALTSESQRIRNNESHPRNTDAPSSNEVMSVSPNSSTEYRRHLSLERSINRLIHSRSDSDSFFLDIGIYPRNDRFELTHEFKCSSLLNLCLKESFKVLELNIEDYFFENGKMEIDNKQKDQKNSTKEPFKVAPSIKLLTLLQRDLFKKVPSCKNLENDLVNVFIEYCNSLLNECHNFLKHKILLRKSEIFDPSNHESDLYKILSKSVFGQILPLVINVIILLLNFGNFSEILLDMNASVEKFILLWNELLEPITLIKKYKNIDFIPKLFERLVIESPHPYYSNIEINQTVEIPKATHLVIYFDSKCRTEKEDYLALYDSSDKILFEKLSGTKRNWPNDSIILPVNSIRFYFKSGSVKGENYGFRCVVSGHCFSYDQRLWMLDLQKCLCHLYGNIMRLIVFDNKLDSIENKCRKWIASPIFNYKHCDVNSNQKILSIKYILTHKFINILNLILLEFSEVERKFMIDLLNSKKNSFAEKLWDFMNKMMVHEPTDFIINDKIILTVKLFIAASLKHLKLIKKVISFKNDLNSLKHENNSKIFKYLTEVWKNAKKLKNYIIKEKQRLSQQLDNEDKNNNKKGNSYNEICSHIIEKLLFILSRPHINIKDSLKKSSNHTKNNAWKEFFEAKNIYKSKEKLKETIISLIFDFSKSSKNLIYFVTISKIHNTRAKKRCQSLKSFLKVINSLNLPTFTHSLLDSFGSPFRAMSSSKNNGYHHYLKNIDLCDIQLKRELKDTFHKFYKFFVNILKDKESSTQLKIISLNAIAIELNKKDCQMIWNYDTLNTLLNLFNYESEENNKENIEIKEINTNCENIWIKKVAKVVYEYICYQCSNIDFSIYKNSPELTATNFVDECMLINEFAFEISINRLHKYNEELKTYYKNKYLLFNSSDSRNNDDSFFYNKSVTSDINFNRQEKHCFDNILYISTNISILNNLKFNIKKLREVLEKLFDLLSVGTPRIQGVTLMIIRNILPQIDPQQFISLNLKYSNNSKYSQNSNGFVLYILNLIGKFIAINYNCEIQNTCQIPIFNFRNGLSVQRLALDYVMIIRMLLKSDKWKELIIGLLKKSIGKINSIISHENHTIKKDKLNTLEFYEIFGSLSIIGGYYDIFRVGCRVETIQKSDKKISIIEKGTLISINRDMGLCKVHFDNMRTRIVECSISKLRPHSEIPVDENIFQLDDETLGAFIPFLDFPNEDLKSKDVIIEEKLENEKVKKEKIKLWNCPLCTFLNKSTMQTCAMCNSTNPKCIKNNKLNKNKETKKESKITIAPESSDTEILYQSLRSHVVKVICNLLKSPKSTSFLLHQTEYSEVLSKFVNLAVKPTRLNEFGNLNYLKVAETRLMELLYDKSKGIDVYDPRMIRKITLKEILPCSIFKYMQIDMPTSFDISSSKNVKFIRNENLRIASSFKETNFSNIAFIRANHLIPANVKAFYFEIILLKNGLYDMNKDNIENFNKKCTWNFAIGLYRGGMVIKDQPGNNASYVYTSKNGSLFHHNKEIKANEKDNFSWEANDVIGCGYDIRKKIIYFTKNGKLINNNFTNITGRFYPMVWTEIPYSNIKINFGHETFSYDFEKTIPREYIQSLINDTNQNTLSSAERKRRANAEILVELMGHFPVEVCQMALEHANDDMQSAANWLIENGWREIERMGDALITNTKIKDSKNNTQAIISNQPNSDSEDEKFEWDVFKSRDNSRRSTAQNYLDDEIEDDIPIGIEMNEIPNSYHIFTEPSLRSNENGKYDNLRDGEEYSFRNISIDEIEEGQLLTVSTQANTIIPSKWTLRMNDFLGKTGIVKFVDVNKSNIWMEIIDSTKAIKYFTSFPLVCVHYPYNSSNDPWVTICENEKNDVSKKGNKIIYGISSHLLEIQKVLCIRIIRRTIFDFFTNWSLYTSAPFSTSFFGGKNLVIKLLSLVAAEFLTSGHEYHSTLFSKSKNDLIEKFRKRIIFILQIESDNFKKDNIIFPLRIYENILKNNNSLAENISKIHDSNSNKYPLTTVLTEECILHFIQSINNPIPILAYRSSGHKPYESHANKRGCISIPGARALYVTFDSRCRLSNDMLTCLKFYRDSKYNELLISFKGSNNGNKYRSFVVPSNRFYFIFKSSGDTNYWGYRFIVKPLEVRIDDAKALDCHNFELGCWILDLLLSFGPKYVKYDYISYIFQALARYVVNSRSHVKVRGVQLLNRIMLSVKKHPPKKLFDYSILTPLSKEIEDILSKTINIQKNLQSPLLQSFLEMLSVVKLIQNKKEEKNTKSVNKPKIDLSSVIDISELNMCKFFIISAKYCCLSSYNKTDIDVTKEIKIHLNKYANVILYIPNRQDWNKIFGPKNDPAPDLPPEAKYLFIKYNITKKCYYAESKEIRIIILNNYSKTFDNDHSIKLYAEPSYFDKVAELSSITLDIECGRSLSSSLLSEAFYSQKIKENYYQIANELEIPHKIKYYSVPSPLEQNYIIKSVEASYMFWIYINTKFSGAPQYILQKGVSISGSVSCPSISLHDSMKLFITTDSLSTRHIHISNKIIPLKKWTHIAVTFEKELISLYIDGIQDSISGDNLMFIENDDPIIIGKLPYGVKRDKSEPDGVNGSLLDIRYYSLKLSSNYIKEYVKESTPIKISDTNCKLNKKYDPFPIIHLRDLDNASMQSRIKWTREMDKQVIEMASRTIEFEKRVIVEDSNNNNKTEEDEDGNITQVERWLENNENYSSPASVNDDLINFDTVMLNHDNNSNNAFPLISHLPISTIRERFSAIRVLNHKVAKILPLIDFSQANLSWSLASRLSSLRSLIFFSTKTQVWNEVLNDTSRHETVSVKLNRPRALKAKEKGDIDGKKSVFGQLYRQLHFIRPNLLRTHGKTWTVTYEGEGGQDAGGLFRDSLSVICDDLQSNNVPILIKCQNGRLGYGNNQDKFIPSPSATSSLHLSMFAFLGKLMGIAIRGHHVLNLDFPAVIWRPLVGDKIRRKDITAIDAGFVNFLETLENAEKDPNLNESNFRDLFPYNFTVLRSDGKEVELKPNGFNIPVTYSNCKEFVNLLEKYRCKEFKLQIESIIRGLGTIVPIQLLPLFTENELEFMVCGKRNIDIDFLKANTLYKKGIKSDDQHVKWLWEVLKEFGHDERQKFLRFVWGQSRLPLTQEDFRSRFEIVSAFKDNDDSLPVSHTCFFSLELPKYSKKSILKEKLRYAIHNCQAIDTDFQAENINWDEDKND